MATLLQLKSLLAVVDRVVSPRRAKSWACPNQPSAARSPRSRRSWACHCWHANETACYPPRQVPAHWSTRARPYAIGSDAHRGGRDGGARHRNPARGEPAQRDRHARRRAASRVHRAASARDGPPAGGQRPGSAGLARSGRGRRRRGHPPAPGLQGGALGSQEMVAVVPVGHRLALRDEVTYADLAREAFIRSTGGCAQVFTPVARQLGVEFDVAFEAREMSAVLEMVRAGLGVSILPTAGLPDLPGGSSFDRWCPRRPGISPSPSARARPRPPARSSSRSRRSISTEMCRALIEWCTPK